MSPRRPHRVVNKPQGWTMNKLGNKGRTLVVFGAMVVGTVSLFGSAAFACGGSTGSNSYQTTRTASFKTADFGSTYRHGQDPHLDTACVALTNISLNAAPTATFQLVAPTASGAAQTLAANGNGAYDVSGMISA